MTKAPLYNQRCFFYARFHKLKSFSHIFHNLDNELKNHKWENYDILLVFLEGTQYH